MVEINPMVAELLDDWHTHLQAKGRSETTWTSYHNVVRAWAVWMEENGRDVTSPHQHDVEAYLAERGERNSASDAAKHYRSLQQWFKWLEMEEELAENPMRKMSVPKVPRKPVPVIPDREIAALLKACEGKSLVNRRDEAALRLYIDTGARLSEIANARVDDIDWTLDVLHVMGKGSKRRAVPFGPKTKEVLRRYVRMRRRQVPVHEMALWIGKRGPLTPNGMAQMMKRRAADAGIKLHAHMFRHTFAHWWKANGGEDIALARIAGWDDLSMAKRYGESAADEAARAAHKRLAPGDRF